MSSGLVNFIQNEIEQTMLQNCTFACISLEKLAETVDRIEKLEAALQKIAYDVGGEYGRKEMMSIAQSAIGGKDG
jgi:conjugal transfer/entry exclusion protein